MSIWTWLTLGVVALLVLDGTLRAHLLNTVHNLVGSVGTAAEHLWSSFTNKKPPTTGTTPPPNPQ